jgi:ABC-type multidrug transport system ATPase subunit
VTFSYGRVRALQDVSLVLWPGELAYLVGPSGAGKTTLLRLAHGVLGLMEQVAEEGTAVLVLPAAVPHVRAALSSL